MKLLFACILVFLAFSVSYSQTNGQGKNFRSPKLIFKNVSSKYKRLKPAMLNKIISPLLCENEKPIEEIIVDFCGKRGCQSEENTGNPLFEVAVNWFDGSSAVIGSGSIKRESQFIVVAMQK